MNEISIRTMDDLRRVVIPKAMRIQLGFDAGDRLTAIPNLSDKSITLVKDDNGGGCLTMDWLGRVEIDKAYVKSMGWKIGCKLAISAGLDGITLTLPDSLTIGPIDRAELDETHVKYVAWGNTVNLLPV